MVMLEVIMVDLSWSNSLAIAFNKNYVMYFILAIP